ncbi:hypothetical protein LTR49_027392 [Elasticomyces elasticus]|nr:hypothetical protein LTR49_027392 [Elasticomyces elasticus]KAK5734190.1 hypothetical protein LTS12_026772 [Elasticomyces elasticus]
MACAKTPGFWYSGILAMHFTFRHRSGARQRRTRANSLAVTTYSQLLILLVKTNAANDKYAYVWRKFCFATWWHPPNTLRVIGIDLPLESRVWIEQSLARLTAAEFAVHPFAIHVVLMEHMIEVYDHAVWFWRDNIRNIERTRSARRQDPDHVEMHEVSRHAVHSLDMLDMALIVVSSMLDEHKRFLDERPSLLPDIVSGVRATSRTLRYQMTVLQSLRGRALAMQTRLSNEINPALAGMGSNDEDTRWVMV